MATRLSLETRCQSIDRLAPSPLGIQDNRGLRPAFLGGVMQRIRDNDKIDFIGIFVSAAAQDTRPMSCST